MAPLTFWGELPGIYEVIINSPVSYGQLSLKSSGSAQPMTVIASHMSAAPTGAYANVVIGLASGEITNEGEITAGGHGILSVLSDATLRIDGIDENWDLNVLNFGTDMAEPQGFFLRQNWLAVRQALDYDCDLFDKHGVCVAWLGGYNSYDGKDIGGGTLGELSGRLIAAKRLNEQVRIGAFMNWRFDGDDIEGIQNIDRLPILGGFLGYSQAANGTGFQMRFSAAYEHGDADFTHANLLGDANSASGNAGFDTYGAGIEAGWGLTLPKQHVMTPFVSLNYVNSTRDGYNDRSAAGDVQDPFSYDAYEEAYTTGAFGVRLKGPLADKANYHLSLGLERVLGGDPDTFRLEGDFGSASYHGQAGLSDWSFTSSIGINYMLDEFKAVTMDAYMRQMEGGLNNGGVSLGYKMGF